MTDGESKKGSEIEHQQHSSLAVSNLIGRGLTEVERGVLSTERPRVLVVSEQEEFIELATSGLSAHNCEAVGSLSFRDHKWVYGEVLNDAVIFRPNTLIFFPNCDSCPTIDGLDLPSMLLRQFPDSKVVITRVGGCESVREDVRENLRLQGRRFDVIDMPFEWADLLTLLRS